jgi:glycosyltransferase involved in cell wall biosynthesis
VIAGNAFLAAHYQAAGNRVWVVPTSIDTNRWRPHPHPAATEFTIGWIGTGSNLGYLLDVEEALAEFLAEEREGRLLVVSDQEPRFTKLPKEKWSFERWTAEREIELVQRMDLGLMPLPDTEWARGKCSGKMLSYMAVGIPVVVSPVGVNLEILERGTVGLPATTKSDWFNALKLLFRDRDQSVRLGSAGRELVERAYSVRKSAPLLERLFREVAG